MKFKFRIILVFVSIFTTLSNFGATRSNKDIVGSEQVLQTQAAKSAKAKHETEDTTKKGRKRKIVKSNKIETAKGKEISSTTNTKKHSKSSNTSVANQISDLNNQENSFENMPSKKSNPKRNRQIYEVVPGNKDTNSNRLLSLLRNLPKMNDLELKKALEQMEDLIRNRASIIRADRSKYNNFRVIDYVNKYIESDAQKYKAFKDIILNYYPRAFDIGIVNSEIEMVNLAIPLTDYSVPAIENPNIEPISMVERQANSKESNKASKKINNKRKLSTFQAIPGAYAKNSIKLLRLLRTLPSMSEIDFKNALENFNNLLENGAYIIMQDGIKYDNLTALDYINKYMESDAIKYKIVKDIIEKYYPHAFNIRSNTGTDVQNSYSSTFVKSSDDNSANNFPLLLRGQHCFDPVPGNIEKNSWRLLSLLRNLPEMNVAEFKNGLIKFDNLLKNKASINTHDRAKDKNFTAIEYVNRYIQSNPDRYTILKDIIEKYHPKAFVMPIRPKKTKINIVKKLKANKNKTTNSSQQTPNENFEIPLRGRLETNEFLDNTADNQTLIMEQINAANIDLEELPLINQEDLNDMFATKILLNNTYLDVPYTQEGDTLIDQESKMVKEISKDNLQELCTGDSKIENSINQKDDTLIALKQAGLGDLINCNLFEDSQILNQESLPIVFGANCIAYQDENVIKIYDTAANKIVNELNGHTDKVIDLCKIDDNKLVSYSIGELILWDIFTGESKLIKTPDFNIGVTVTPTFNGAFLKGRSLQDDQDHLLLFKFDDFIVDKSNVTSSSSTSASIARSLATLGIATVL